MFRLLFTAAILSFATVSLGQWNVNGNSELYTLNPGVGIGVVDPSAKLEIRGSTDNNFLFVRQDKNSGGAGDVIYFRDDRGYGGNNSGTTFKIESWRGYGQQGGTLVNFTTIDNGYYKSRFFINNDNGFVGLGTTSPKVPLQIEGTSLLQTRLRVASASVGSSAAFDVVMAPVNDLLHDSYAAGMRAYVRSGQPGIDRVSLGFYTTTFSSSLESRIERMTITDTGNVGIGTSKPSSRLEVANGVFSLFGSGLDGSTYQKFVLYADATEGLYFDAPKRADGTRTDIEFNWRGGGTPPLFIDGATGDVSIGTNQATGYKLAVAGKAVAEEIVVKLQGNWPDYVFNERYDLRPLAEIKRYIKENNHLPDVPAAKDVEANGVALGSMNKVLLLKIEELTLYLLQQEERMRSQEQRIKSLEEQVRGK